MKKLIFLLVFLFSMLSGNEIAWKQNISNGIQYHVKCNNGEQSDVFYYYDSKRYFVGGIGDYASLDSAKQHACKTTSQNSHIVTIKAGALLLATFKKMKHALRSETLWRLEHFNAKTILSKNVNVKLLKIYHIKGKSVGPDSNWHYIDDIVKIVGKDGLIMYARKSEITF